jgi:hypothetical protein
MQRGTPADVLERSPEMKAFNDTATGPVSTPSGDDWVSDLARKVLSEAFAGGEFQTQGQIREALKVGGFPELVRRGRLSAETLDLLADERMRTIVAHALEQDPNDPDSSSDHQPGPLSKSPFFRRAYSMVDEADTFESVLVKLLEEASPEDRLEASAAMVEVWYLRRRRTWYESDAIQEGHRVVESLERFGLDPHRVADRMRNVAPTNGAGFLWDALLAY